MSTRRDPFPLRALLVAAVDGAVAAGHTKTEVAGAAGLLAQNLNRVLHGDGTSEDPDAGLGRPATARAILGACGYHVALVRDGEPVIAVEKVRAVLAHVLDAMEKVTSDATVGPGGFLALVAVAASLDAVLGDNTLPRCGDDHRFAVCALGAQHGGGHAGLGKTTGDAIKW